MDGKSWPGSSSLVGHTAIAFSGGRIVNSVPIFRRGNGDLSAYVTVSPLLDQGDQKRQYAASCVMTAANDACRLAINLANNCGFSCFPCNADGTPTTLDGVRNASRIPPALVNFWHGWPGPLIGIATGVMSSMWVLSVETKAVDWWRKNHHRLLPTRAYETRSGGIHLYYSDGDGIGSSRGRICAGVDTHSDGDYVISWLAAGLACRDHSPPAPWPEWLRAALRTAT